MTLQKLGRMWPDRASSEPFITDETTVAKNDFKCVNTTQRACQLLSRSHRRWVPARSCPPFCGLEQDSVPMVRSWGEALRGEDKRTATTCLYFTSIRKQNRRGCGAAGAPGGCGPSGCAVMLGYREAARSGARMRLDQDRQWSRGRDVSLRYVCCVFKQNVEKENCIQNYKSLVVYYKCRYFCTFVTTISDFNNSCIFAESSMTLS